MFNAVTSEPKILRDSIDTISQLIDEGIFKLKRDGIELIATDRAMVAVVEFKLGAGAFDEYACDEDKEIGINLLNFLTILKRAGPDDKLKLQLKEDEKLEVTLKGKSTRKFAIPLLNITKEEVPPVDQLDFSASAEIRSGIIEQGIADADIVADSVMFELDEEKFKMFAEGDSSKSELVLEKGNEFLVSLNARQSIKSRYPLDYLKKIIKASKISDITKINLGTDYPMRIEFMGDNISFRCILAPRVSED
ncbi:MAG: proliferating cell nuclear antigen (pcna) [Nanoarchaeota archaeon]|nr:proliferating cell nuclear antigen (pcna) [Nanoarchaeota archaeon]MBU4123866.1 proliferating cell nuclear antigen (pcna) [Nanoarchaeota archaeon]